MAMERRPIKVVVPREQDFAAPHGGGGGAKLFPDFSDDDRQRLIGQVNAVVQHFQPALAQASSLPVVARVTLKPKALAKSHRPVVLFNEDTCPVIGDEALGELLVSATADSLGRLAARMTRPDRRVTAALSTIQKIEPFDLRLGSTMAEMQALVRLAGTGRPLKLRLFNHRDPRQNEALEVALR